MLPVEVKQKWQQWVNQVPLIHFNSGKYDLNMVKKLFVKEISFNKGRNSSGHIFAAKNENNYIFVTTSKFKFLDIKNYIETRLLWCFVQINWF